jgi:DHA2 family methylenomycin A resistance protein-like MFS transporter
MAVRPAAGRREAPAGDRHTELIVLVASRRHARGTRQRPAREPLPPGAWARLAACTGAAALLQLDGTLITVALPSVARDLGVSGSSASIVLSAYFGMYAVLLWPGGLLVDRFGARRIALLGLLLFALGAAVGAAAPTLGVLIAMRIIQGAGAGLVSPAALAGAVSGFPAERRGTALGIWGASAGVSNLLGPLMGGLLTVAFGWRADWWALVPLALVSAWTILRLLPPTARGDDLTPKQTVFNQVVMAAAFIAALTFAVMIGAFYLAEQYLQRAAGYSALGASSVLLLVALLVGAAAPIAGRLADRRGERLPALLGFVLAGAGLGVLAISAVPLGSAVTLLPLVPVGLGLGMLFVPVSRAALNATPLASHGRTSALLSVGRLLGAAIGAGLAGLALAGGVTASTVHSAMLVACALCVAVGLPVSSYLGASIGRLPRTSRPSESPLT